MRRIHLVTTAALCVAAFIGAGTSPAVAGPGKAVVRASVASHASAPTGDKAPAAVNAPTTKAKPPAGYVHVQSSPFSAPSGEQSAGSVSCPGKKVPLGGGVVIASDDVNTNINSSYPSGSAWVADVNNGGTDTTFVVYAVCANKPKGYQVVDSGAVTSPAASQAEGFVACPGSTVPWGGGVFSTSGSGGANVNSSYPTGDTTQVWNVYMNNGTASDTAFIVYAVCAAKPHLYGQSFATGTDNPNSEDNASGACGAGGVVVGGGLFSSSTSYFVNMNSTEPYTNTQWRTFENNATSNSYEFSAYAVCVGYGAA